MRGSDNSSGKPACGVGHKRAGKPASGDGAGDRRVDAVILGVEYQALGLVRELGRAGVRCVLVDEDAWGPARFSRYARACRVSPPYTHPEYWGWLRDMAVREDCRGALLIPTHDEQVRALAEHHDEVTRFYRYAGLPWPLYRRVYDKRLAHALALELGLDCPAAYVPTPDAPLPAEGELGSPFVVKPAFKREFARVCKRKAVLVHSNADLRRLLAGPFARVPVDHLIYQALITGGGEGQWSYAGFFVEGRPVAAFTAVRRRQKPPDFGRASTFVTAEPNAEIERESLRLLAALRYTGLAEVEWKRDERTGRLLFLEMNARCWGWRSLASRVVGNLPLLLHQYVSAGSAEPVEPRYGARWVKWITDVPVALHMMATGKLRWRDYVGSLRGDLVSGDWDRADPLPFLAQFALIPYLLVKRGY